MASSSYLLRAAFGFVAGSTIGYFGHERIQKTARSLLKTPNNTSEEEYWRLPTLPSTSSIKPWDNNWDRKDPKSLVQSRKKKKLSLNGTKADENNNQLSEDDEIKKFTPKATRHLLLIRHGQYLTDAPTDESRMLTPLGVEQGDMTGRRLLELNLPYTVLVHSSMTRARETAAAILKYLPDVPVVVTDLLREGAPCPPEPPLSSWTPDYRLYQDSARIEAAFRKYFHRADPKQQEDSYEIIVCHANVIRYFVCRALQLPPEAWLRISLNHGSITWVSIRPTGRVTLRALGDSGYMPYDKVTLYN